MYLKGSPTPDECLERHSLPCAELCLDRLKGMGVPWGEMKGVLHSEADPKVAARDISDPDDPNGPFVVAPGTPPGPPPCGSICRGNALPLLCRDLIIWTGVLLGDIKGEAEGLWGSEPCLGDIGWKLQCLLRAPGLGPPTPPTTTLPFPFWGNPLGGGCCCCCCCTAGSCTIKLTRRRVLKLGCVEVRTGSAVVLMATPLGLPHAELPRRGCTGIPEGDFNFSTSIVLSCDNFWLSSLLLGELSLKYLSTSSSMGSFISNWLWGIEPGTPPPGPAGCSSSQGLIQSKLLGSVELPHGVAMGAVESAPPPSFPPLGVVLFWLSWCKKAWRGSSSSKTDVYWFGASATMATETAGCCLSWALISK